MTLTKNKMIREIGRRTRLKNRDVQLMLEALVEVWIEELVSGGRIELENFLVLETVEIQRKTERGLFPSISSVKIVKTRCSKALRSRLKGDIHLK